MVHPAEIGEMIDGKLVLDEKKVQRKIKDLESTNQLVVTRSLSLRAKIRKLEAWLKRANDGHAEYIQKTNKALSEIKKETTEWADFIAHVRQLIKYDNEREESDPAQIYYAVQDLADEFKDWPSDPLFDPDEFVHSVTFKLDDIKRS